jgi:hypothetical protein
MSELGEFDPQLPKIEYWWVPRVIPSGGAAEEIKKQWVDVPLPCRIPRPEGPEVHLGHDVGSYESVHFVEDGVSISVEDAVKSLSLFGREDAADWWNLNYAGRDLVFRINEGDILPNRSAETLLPGLERFDEL